ARILYPYLKRLRHKYRFNFIYLGRGNQWGTKKSSTLMIRRELSIRDKFLDKFGDWDNRRLLELYEVDAIYSTMMGTAGENGNLPGLADLMGKPMIGCGILASALCLDKVLAKRLAASAGIKVVD